jgi:hypothetical protein
MSLTPQKTGAEMQILGIRPETGGRTLARFDLQLVDGVRLYNLKLMERPNGARRIFCAIVARMGERKIVLAQMAYRRRRRRRMKKRGGNGGKQHEPCTPLNERDQHHGVGKTISRQAPKLAGVLFAAA